MRLQEPSVDTTVSSRQPLQPLLTIAVPTFNRAEYLANLLRVLAPQLAKFPQVELYVSDNCSDDDTPRVIAEAAAHFKAIGANLRAHRHDTNIGSDANFASIYAAARGTFFWGCGDDDIITPGALAMVIPHLDPDRVDLLYATSYGFHRDFVAERQGDPLNRRFQTIHNPRTFASIVNILFTFISGMIVNRERLESIPHEDPAAFIGTNLVQLSWSLPLLPALRSAVVLYQRPVASRLGNAHGYSLGGVFGRHLKANVNRLLPGHPAIAAPIINFALRNWFPGLVVDIRAAGNTTLQLEQAHTELRDAFGSNPRYWVFTYPALRLPLGIAKMYVRGVRAINKAVYMLRIPGFWRKQT